MAKLKSPFFSFGATGRLGKALTVARRLTGPVWLLRGRPADPRTEPQLSWRTMWQLAAELWHELSESEILEWERAGTRRGMTGFAWYMSQALRPNPGIYLPLAGGQMTGNINMAGHQVKDLPGPDTDQDAATKKYHDDNLPACGYTAGCRITDSAHQAIPRLVLTTVRFNTTIYDTDDMHDGVAYPYRITIKTAGIYLILTNIRWNNDVFGYRYLYLRASGGPYFATSMVGLASTGDLRHEVSTIYKFVAGDYVELRAYQNTAGALDIHKIDYYSPIFCAQRIG